MTEQGIERWTIYVCPNCGKRHGGAYFCRCVIPSSRCQKVEVLPASILNDCIEELERRAGDIPAQMQIEVGKVEGYEDAANFLREKAGQ